MRRAGTATREHRHRTGEPSQAPFRFVQRGYTATTRGRPAGHDFADTTRLIVLSILIDKFINYCVSRFSYGITGLCRMPDVEERILFRTNRLIPGVRREMRALRLLRRPLASSTPMRSLMALS